MRCRHLIAALWLTCLSAGAPARAVAPPVQQSPGVRAIREIFDFLIGVWEPEGSREAGRGAGGFVFETALGGNLVLRRSLTDRAAGKDGSGLTRQDFMVVYAERGQVRADCFDHGGGVIHYTVSFAHESATVTFVSPVAEGQARHRLTYRPLSTDRVEVVFESAPPDRANAFTTYLRSVCRRVKPSADDEERLSPSSVTSVISARLNSRMGGPQKPVPRETIRVIPLTA